MLKFISVRLLQMSLLFLVFLTLLFFLLQAQPGDFSRQFLDPNIPPENRDLIAARFGLDKPLWQQYFTYMINVFQGDFGLSFQRYPRTVTSVITERLPRTFFLFTLATLLSYYLGFIFGKVLAWRRGGKQEMGITLSGVFLYTVFYPWFALVMIWFFAAYLDLVPVNQFITPLRWREAPFSANSVFSTIIWSTLLLSAGLALSLWLSRKPDNAVQQRLIKWGGIGLTIALFLSFWLPNDKRAYATDIAHHAVLPIFTLALVAFAGVMLITRGSMLETLKEDYILTARAKGLPPKVIRDRHAARNALLPVTTSFVLGLAFIIGGGLITETVFSWPGMGELLLTSVVTQDIPVAIGALAMVGALALIGHVIVDVLYVFLDPRIRYQ
ncbi:MAG: ABC transporter permease [Acidimicrobiia bacterium]